MSEYGERTRSRSVVARDPLADLGEIELAGVLRRVRPAGQSDFLPGPTPGVGGGRTSRGGGALSGRPTLPGAAIGGHPAVGPGRPARETASAVPDAGRASRSGSRARDSETRRSAPGPGAGVETSSGPEGPVRSRGVREPERPWQPPAPPVPAARRPVVHDLFVDMDARTFTGAPERTRPEVAGDPRAEALARSGTEAPEETAGGAPKAAEAAAPHPARGLPGEEERAEAPEMPPAGNGTAEEPPGSVGEEPVLDARVGTAGEGDPARQPTDGRRAPGASYGTFIDGRSAVRFFTGVSGSGAARDAAETERRYEEGKRYAAAGEYGHAIEAYHDVLRRDPRHLRARNNLGFAYDCRGDHELAINEYMAALELDPRNVQIYCNLGAVYGAQGRYDKAEDALKQASRLDPKSAEAHCNLGIVYCKKGMYHLATAELKRALELRLDYVQANYYLGECYNHLDRCEDAIQAFEKALEGHPQNPKAYYSLGILYDKQNMPDRAMLMYRRARELQVGGGRPPGA